MENRPREEMGKTDNPETALNPTEPGGYVLEEEEKK